MKDHTVFRFTMKQDEGTLHAEIRIYNQTGLLVRTIESDFSESSQGMLMIPWDGTGEQGSPLSQGLYIYRLIVKSSSGAYFQASQKLVIGY